MKTSHALLTVLLLASTTSPSPALQDQDSFYDDPALVRLLELGREDNRVSEPLLYLSKEVGHRLTGSSNLQRACEWARFVFAELGLDARLERWGEFPVGFDRYEWSGGMVAPEQIDYHFNTLAWSGMRSLGPALLRGDGAPVWLTAEVAVPVTELGSGSPYVTPERLQLLP